MEGSVLKLKHLSEEDRVIAFLKLPLSAACLRQNSGCALLVCIKTREVKGVIVLSLSQQQHTSVLKGVSQRGRVTECDFCRHARCAAHIWGILKQPAAVRPQDASVTLDANAAVCLARWLDI